MTKPVGRALAILVLLALPAACDSGNGGAAPGGASGQTSATLKGPFAQEKLAASVLWQVSTQQDYTYILGGGTTSGGQASLSVPVSTTNDGKAALDPLALNQFDDGSAVGVGYVIVTNPADAPKQSAKAGDEDNLKMRGISARYAFIFRADEGDKVRIAWAKAFPQGLSCGRCVPKTSEQGSFDTWEPVDCASLEIETSEKVKDLDVCNWT
jgi:hypothetical protein